MPGPCPAGAPTKELHKKSRCQNREQCQGPGCRVRRPKRNDPIVEAIQRDHAEKEEQS